MANLDSLRAALPVVKDLQMKAQGYALWLVWQGDMSHVVLQTLGDYGGVHVVEENGQSLWFFFTNDVFLAAARLSVWANFNQLSMGMHIFPCRLSVDRGGAKNAEFDDVLRRQNIKAPSDFQIWVHSGIESVIEGIPGLGLDHSSSPEGAVPGVWSRLTADSRLPYQSSLGWYAVLQPVGNPLDKAFQSGWREFFGQLESILQRNKFRYTLNNFFLMFPLDGLRQIKSWCRDYLVLVDRLKQETPEHFWPCVLAVVDRKGLNFNEDLPKKIGLSWEQLTPDFPHMAIKTALMLGEEFQFHGVRFAPAAHAPEDWTSVSLVSSDMGKLSSLPQLVPASLVLGDFPHCFYCGHRSHAAAHCPTRLMPPHDSAVWNAFAAMDFSAMQAGVKAIEETVAGADNTEERNSRIVSLAGENSPAGTSAKALFDINWAAQLRSLRFFWRIKTKDLHRAASDLIMEDDSPVWAMLDSLPSSDIAAADKELANLALRFPKDFRIISLRGFVAVEAGDLQKALGFWKEAEMFSSSPPVQAWHVFLQARANECMGRFFQAEALYEQVMRLAPSWIEAEYRRMVCEVKEGFSERAAVVLTELISRSGHFFNRALIDPEMERGVIQVSLCLSNLWTVMEAKAVEEEARLHRLRDELSTWFMPGHAFAEKIAARIQKLIESTKVNNYVAHQIRAQGRVHLEREVQQFVTQEAKIFKTKFQGFTERLQAIHNEAAWFPFPRALVDFNKGYAQSVENLTWAVKANLHLPESFRKAQIFAEQEAERIKKLENRMRFLRMVRDSTLFVLSVAESFFWIELAGTLCIFVLLPLILVYGDKVGLEWTAGMISKERWQVQKALFFIISVLAVGIAGLRTILRFDNIRDKVLQKAREAATRQQSRVAAANADRKNQARKARRPASR